MKVLNRIYDPIDSKWIIKHWPYIDMNRICIEEGCDELGMLLGEYRKDGHQHRRDRCHFHHFAHQGAKKGMNDIEWQNSFQDYRKYRVNYCENEDGRLGFKCANPNVIWEGMLDVDHIDGNHDNNDEYNLQTLCKCCHAYKSNWQRVNKDDDVNAWLFKNLDEINDL